MISVDKFTNFKERTLHGDRLVKSGQELDAKGPGQIKRDRPKEKAGEGEEKRMVSAGRLKVYSRLPEQSFGYILLERSRTMRNLRLVLRIFQEK